jgi:hypothetical protein
VNRSAHGLPLETSWLLDHRLPVPLLLSSNTSWSTMSSLPRSWNCRITSARTLSGDVRTRRRSRRPPYPRSSASWRMDESGTVGTLAPGACPPRPTQSPLQVRVLSDDNSCRHLVSEGVSGCEGVRRWCCSYSCCPR